ncbi:hypothetical protein RvY_10078 [Ramazzottius varieornatus]|uniref:Uncharacterized protein n=1 Tax=Ramazzottius varieornatus TaxID=947166 RepID=A0A1D1VGX6_RAMVA|nr:hypothetical protein RvY_10078 [Ramazzottius varieornatus]
MVHNSSGLPVIIAGVATIVGIHWAWWEIQKNPGFVDPRDVRPHPFIEAWRYWRSGKYMEKPKKSEDSPAVPSN